MDYSDSTTYMAIIDIGRTLQARRDILVVGQQLFGFADKTIRDCLQVKDLDQLRQIRDRLFDVATWQDLLDTL
jgi:hypothetical protein